MLPANHEIIDVRRTPRSVVHLGFSVDCVPLALPFDLGLSTEHVGVSDEAYPYWLKPSRINARSRR